VAQPSAARLLEILLDCSKLGRGKFLHAILDALPAVPFVAD